MAQTNWMLVSSADNFERARAIDFTVLGMKSRHRKKAERVQPGDRVLYYATGVQAFAGTFTVTSPYFESTELLWQSKKAGETYPFRFHVKPDVVLPSGVFLPVIELIPRLEWVKKWPAEHWRLAFQGNVHVLPDNDFATIEAALREKLAPVRA